MNPDKIELENNLVNKENIIKNFNSFLNEKFLLICLFLLIFSYFYNLPVLKYSIKGDNEFRLYDIVGVIIIYYFYKYNRFILSVINKVLFLKMLYRFIVWCCITMIITFFYCIIKNSLTTMLQIILYMYHFWVFYLGSVFLYIFFLKKNIRLTAIYLIIIVSIISCLIVILQNLGLIDFLWNNVYRKSYLGFLSGTLGPNKIVLGMTSLFVFSLCLGVLLEKHISVNRILLYSCIILNIYIIIVSGSRTTYVGLGIIILYFAIRSPFKFIFISFFFALLFSLTITQKPELYKSLQDTLEYRILGKTSFFENEDSAVGDLYSDLGAGRDQLTVNNFLQLIEEPYIIPFGKGFVNHFDKRYGKSAHNMYIQSIKETGIIGFFLYFGWLISYLFIKFDKFSGFSLALNGLVLAMLVTLFFGEHLYIYRPLFGLLGLFLTVTVIFVSFLHKIELKELKYEL